MNQLRVLIATTTWWPSAARLAVAFHGHGALVSAICPHGHPMRVLRSLRAVHAYSALAPLDTLARAIRQETPDLIVPTDDRVVAHLHALHASATAHDPDSVALRALIERSLGAPDGFSLSGTRDRLLQAVQADGVRVPAGRSIAGVDDLRAWFAARPGRCVIKTEGSWGGSGVSVVHTLADAEAAFLAMSQPLTLRRAVRILLFDGDPFPFVQCLRRERRTVTVQAFIEGRQANIMAACRDGHLLDTLSVDVLRAQNGIGAATVVRMVDCPEMEAAAAIVARRIGASGLFGLDFMIETATGLYYLIEMNPRATQLGHLARRGRDLAAALVAALGGTPRIVATPADEDQVVALFPQALRFEADWLERNRTRIDVPVDQPQLTAELLRRPWTKRSPFARIEGWLRDNDANGKVLSQRRAATLLAKLASQRTEASRDIPSSRIARLGGGLMPDHISVPEHRRRTDDDRVVGADIMEGVSSR
ncbi:ATP-grasp domain-containing protein [Lichenicola cladoniae]|uniref:ATP-grasp domain-containing protein n=1 Tax=Lichenicola cladoniae TaxID=1484109 RepID=A0A6M8HLF2_9PROT|nr:ATP-grasp domain-containing protein [Lichenicola cladoniae]QKE89170.1 ATP-grasp domain-containing protein [Lichenicola cladoniae]